jgi:hypothetical protein
MNRSDDVRRYALTAARAELARLLELFPELRDELPQPVASRRDKHHAAVKSRTLAHWRKTAAPAATNGNARAKSGLRDRVEQSLTATPQTIAQLTAKVNATDYQHTAATPLSNRVAQEVAQLRKYGISRKTKRGWRLAKGGAA